MWELVDITELIETKEFAVGSIGGEHFFCTIQFDKDAEEYNVFIWADGFMTKDFVISLPEYQPSEDTHYGWDDIIEMAEQQDWVEFGVEYLNNHSEYHYEAVDEG